MIYICIIYIDIIMYKHVIHISYIHMIQQEIEKPNIKLYLQYD